MKKLLIVLLLTAFSTATMARNNGGMRGMKGMKGLGSTHSHTPTYPRGGQYDGTGSNSANHYVRGHNSMNRGYVGPHYRTNPNGTQRDNYGTHGNYNYHNGNTGGSWADH